MDFEIPVDEDMPYIDEICQLWAEEMMGVQKVATKAMEKFVKKSGLEWNKNAPKLCTMIFMAGMKELLQREYGIITPRASIHLSRAGYDHAVEIMMQEIKDKGVN